MQTQSGKIQRQVYGKINGISIARHSKMSKHGTSLEAHGAPIKYKKTRRTDKLSDVFV